MRSKPSIQAFSTTERKIKGYPSHHGRRRSRRHGFESHSTGAKRRGEDICDRHWPGTRAFRLPDPMGSGFKRNRSGEIVLSKINEPLLEKIAVDTGGAYVRSVLGDRDLQTIYLDKIQQSMEKRDLKSSRRKRWTERFQWWIFAGLLCLAGERWVREK